ncbi:SCRIB [Lepeophtheirus salmonis]|uniref:SCRIB n=1 Tax=Lepeophtheirus salmonis TaxID=72036 RepID=A0A7R8H1N5_LEPSM|nr:SCRIB [Lepeophtheirus salmonis]CAF2797395.1 SCRIB [Lepeophtheirus salmonis]
MSYSFKKKSGYIGDDTFMYGKTKKNNSSEPKILSFKYINEDTALPGPQTKELIVNSEHFHELNLIYDDAVIVGSVGEDTAKETGIRIGDRLIAVSGVCVVSFTMEQTIELITRELRNSSKLNKVGVSEFGLGAS